MATIEAKKADRRVIRTRSAIRKAFTDLLAETAYNKITITALAKRADVDRKTFYTHYSSVEFASRPKKAWRGSIFVTSLPIPHPAPNDS